MKPGFKEVPMTTEEEREQRRLSAERSAKAGSRWGRTLGFGAVNLVASLGGLVVGTGYGLVKGGLAVGVEAWDAGAEGRVALADNIKERLDRIADMAEDRRPATTVRIPAEPAAEPAAKPRARPTVQARKTENGRTQVIEGEVLDPVTHRP